MKYIIERSANHCHLTEQDALSIFGDKCSISNLILRHLAISGEYATNLKVLDTKGNSYTVVYPWRDSSQIEVSQSDYYKLFRKYTNRVNSGDIKNAETIIVNGSISLPVIVVKAHIHIPKKYSLDILPNFIFPLEIKYNETVDDIARIHLDTDQYAAIQGTESTKTECIRKCQLKDDVCLGCNRTIDEIIKEGNKK